MIRQRTDLRRLIGDRAGATAVEFALLAPVLALLAAGAIDATTLILRTMEVRSAAQAGADYALVHGWDAGKVALAVTADSGARISALPAPTLDKACVSGTTITNTTGTSCPAGGAPWDFVTVRAKTHFKPIVPWPGFGVEQDLTAQAKVRLQ